MSSHNSHRKPQTAPPSEKISLTYMHEKAVLGTMFQTVFTPCLKIPLTYKDKNSRFIGLSLICLHFVYVLGALSLT